MYALGMDIGTTNLSAVLVDIKSGEVLDGYTVENDTGIKSESWERLQDAQGIWEIAKYIKGRLSGKRIDCIGLTGQMHGILYTDSFGKAVSPLYTWQDCRGDLIRSNGQTYTQSLSAEVGKNLATGYGSVTHSYNLDNGLVPGNAKWAMTIQDYIAMKLADQTIPKMHITNSESFGAPGWSKLAPMIRTTDKNVCIGSTSDGVPVAVAIGDNQASFIGSVRSSADCLLVNIGTGGQITIAADDVTADYPDVDRRPYVDSGTLLVGYSLCGGYAYELLETMFREIVALSGVQCGSLYEQMNILASQPPEDKLTISTQFRGTRSNPEIRGAIWDISDRNLTPAHLIQAVLQGIVDELLVPYRNMCKSIKRQPTVLVGAGNGIRRNPVLQRKFEEALGMPMNIPVHKEEAAYGAALFAAVACGKRKSLAEAQKVIRYHSSK